MAKIDPLIWLRLILLDQKIGARPNSDGLNKFHRSSGKSEFIFPFFLSYTS